MANIFRAKHLISRTGTFSHEVTAPNIVYNTGEQNISGIKTFYNSGLFIEGINISSGDQTLVLNKDLLDFQMDFPPEYEISGYSFFKLNATTSNPYIEIENTSGLFNGGNFPYISLKDNRYKNYPDGTTILDRNLRLFDGDITLNSGNKITFDTAMGALGIGDLVTLRQRSNLYSVDAGQLKTDAIRLNASGTTGLFLELYANNLVYNTGDQTISGLKDFTTRPTVNTVPVLLSGENANGLSALVKNDDVITLVKGQPVYIYGANGNNILVRAASNTGEAFSSKTLGLLSQTLAPNAEGYVTTEGTLEGVDTSLAGSVGDPIWLGPTGNLIFGLAQKPYAPNHLVYLGVVERKQANNGKIYVKIQNGFEIDELHNVNINHTYSLSNEDILRYNSASGLWFNQPLNTGIFQSEINSLSGAAVLTYGDQNISGNKNFLNNISVSGTGIFNALDLGNIDSLSLSGIDISITGSTVNVFGNILISGNPVLTGTTLVQTGVNLQNQISSLSGSLNSSGVVLINTISSLSGNVVFLTGNQIINGLKTFTSGIDIYSGLNPQSIRVFNRTGLNTGEFGIFEWRNNELRIGATQSQSGLLRDVLLTGRNINIDTSGVVNILKNTNIKGNLTVSGNTLFTGNDNRMGKQHYFHTDGDFAYIKKNDGSMILTSEEMFLLDYDGINSVEWGSRLLKDSSAYTSIDWQNKNLQSNNTTVLEWSAQKVTVKKDLLVTGAATFSGQEVNLVDTALNLSGVGDMTFSGTNVNFINSPVYISGTNLRVSGDIYGYNIYSSGVKVLTGVDLSNYATKSLAIAYAIAL